MRRTMIKTGKRRLVVVLGMGLLFLTGMLVAVYQNSAVSGGVPTFDLGIVGESSGMDASDWVADDCLDTQVPGRTMSSTGGEGGEEIPSGTSLPGDHASSPVTPQGGDASTVPGSVSPATSQEGEDATSPEAPGDGGSGDDAAVDDGTAVIRPPHDWDTSSDCPGR